MNSSQLVALSLKGVTVVGTIIGIVGLVPPDQWAAFADAFAVWIKDTAALAGPAMVVGAAIVGHFTHSPTAQIAAVNAIDGVKVVAQSAPAMPVDKAP